MKCDGGIQTPAFVSRLVCNTGPLITLGLLDRLTCRILVEAKRHGLLAEVASSFKKLRQEGYWIHDTIVEAALREAEESV